MKLREIAFTRSGDKGNTANIAAFVYHKGDWDHLRQHVTADAVRELFGDLVQGDVRRYELPGTNGLNFVLTEALEGGAANGLLIDPWGKAFQTLLLELDLPDRSSPQQ